MTIAELRKQFPSHSFMFFKNGWELQKAPFFHDKIKSFREVGENSIFIEMP